MGEPTILTLVRHGQTQANVDQVWHGSVDTELTELGRGQAARVAEKISCRYPGVTAVYSSGLRRARDTAAAIGAALHKTPLTDEDLREFGIGDWEGESYKYLLETRRLWERLRDDPEFAPPGGESTGRVCARVSAALYRASRAHPGGRVVLVVHGAATSIALGNLVGNGDRGGLANCSISELVLDPLPELLSFNLTDHLDGL